MLQEIVEGAHGLHRSGVIGTRRLQEYNVLCTPAPKFTGEDVKQLRARMNVSQPFLALLIGTSPSTVRAWEAGQKNPGGPSCRLLDILSRKGIEVLLSSAP
jgi:putative transcriptional regulator